MPPYPGNQGGASSPQPPAGAENGLPIYLIGLPSATMTQFPPMQDSDVKGETSAAIATWPSLASIALALPGSRDLGAPLPNVGVEFLFSVDPGVCDIEVQEADTDGDKFYITPAPSAFKFTTATKSTDGVTFVGRIDLGTIGSRFLRIKVVSVTNACSIKAKVTIQ